MADREVVLSAVQQMPVQQYEDALQFGEDSLLRKLYLLKLTMLSGRSTVVTAQHLQDLENVLASCRRRLGLTGRTGCWMTNSWKTGHLVWHPRGHGAALMSSIASTWRLVALPDNTQNIAAAQPC
eukprot:4740803-Amphidinium_carterae.2